MTTKYQKCVEIIYAKKTGELLDELWEVEPSPDEVSWPDLIVTTKLGKFGLEVRELYLDESSKGSAKKAIENNNMKNINKLANAYYKTTYYPIKADFLGDIGRHDQILNTLIRGVEQLSEFEQKRLEPYNGCVIYIQRLPDQLGEYKRWNYVSDKVGWVSKIDQKVIEMAVVEKAKNLPKYSKKISDVRLLLVSDRIFNSGKARIANDIICDAHGFYKVYYLSYPEEVWQVSS
ncbi:MAG: hypothetical protein AB1711_07040 [Thermodesulfobacteriota bacterium]